MFGYRWLSLYGLMVCVGALLFAVFYLEDRLLLEPCPLCVLDRVVFVALGGVFLVALVHGPRPVFARLYGLIAAGLCLIGIGLASRHIWLQGLPKDQVPECGADIYFMLDTLPLLEVIRESLSGSGECAEVVWTFLGLSIPEQTLILFGALLVLALIQVLRPRQFS